MSLLSFLFFLLIASVTGAIGAKLAGRKKMGCISSIALGFIGALIGNFIAQKLDLPLFLGIRIGSYSFPIIWAVLGSAIFVAFLNLFSRPRK